MLGFLMAFVRKLTDGYPNDGQGASGLVRARCLLLALGLLCVNLTDLAPTPFASPCGSFVYHYVGNENEGSTEHKLLNQIFYTAFTSRLSALYCFSIVAVACVKLLRRFVSAG